MGPRPSPLARLALALAAIGVTSAAQAAAEPRVTRGPYLQSGSWNAVTVRWRTDESTRGWVEYGQALATLARSPTEAQETTEHAVRLERLSPATKYFYAIGAGDKRLAGGDAGTHFITAPERGSAVATRIWAIGDAGWANLNLHGVSDAYNKDSGGAHTDVWLLLGDNAYSSGKDEEYQASLFDMHAALLRRTFVWPTIGNHDVGAMTPESFPYERIFDLPTRAEAGGLASGSERYYSFDHANIHFVCLSSMLDADHLPGSPMYAWLDKDLAATRQDWIVAFWHHPPYSRGTYDSDVDPLMADMRTNAVPVLEKYGVDLVLTGHSHAYERSYLISGHYGAAATLAPAMRLDPGSGRDGAGGPYTKSRTGAGANRGAVYVVAGSASIRQEPSSGFGHPVMAAALQEAGSMVITVRGDRLEARFLRENGAVDDSFVITKGAAAARTNRPPEITLMTDRPSYSDPATVVFTARASDPDGRIVRLELWHKGELLAALDQPPWTYTWQNVPRYDINDRGFETGYPIVARVFDDQGASTVSNVVDVQIASNNQAPQLTVKTSKPLYTDRDPVLVEVEAADPDGRVVSVELFESGYRLARDDTPPFEFRLDPLPVGTYWLLARGTDDRIGRRSVGFVGFEVDPSPPEGSTDAGASLDAGADRASPPPPDAPSDAPAAADAASALSPRGCGCRLAGPGRRASGALAVSLAPMVAAVALVLVRARLSRRGRRCPRRSR